MMCFVLPPTTVVAERLPAQVACVDGEGAAVHGAAGCEGGEAGHHEGEGAYFVFWFVLLASSF